jgi:hypothetical protein
MTKPISTVLARGMNISYFIRPLNKTNTAFFDLAIHESKDIIKVDVYSKPMSSHVKHRLHQ